MSSIIDYRDKTIDYDYILEEFHYEYKLNVNDLINNITLYITSKDEEIKTIAMQDFVKKYPEQDFKDLLDETNNGDIELVNKYFLGYPNALKLAKLAYNCYITNYTIESLEMFNKECPNSGLNIKTIIDNIIKQIDEKNPDRRRKLIKNSLYKRFDNHRTVVKNLYIVQSQKDKQTDLPIIHYSLKEKFLSDFRAIRKQAKKSMEEAELNNDHATYVRFDAKQNAIKKMCNSEYGASGNATFAHYDPDIAAAVTHCARSLIGMLTSNLESIHIFVDKKFIDDHYDDIRTLSEIKALTINHDKYSDELLYNERRHCIRRLFNDIYERCQDDVYKIDIMPSKVIYQDTDSNYYVNYYIQTYFTHNFTECSPDIIDEMMWAMYHHNMLLSDFTTQAIARRPVGLGFEGSFIVCRYLNRKKKYYGKQWSPDGLWFPSKDLHGICAKAYDKNNILKESYNSYWIKKKTILPMEDGTYIDIDYDKLLNNNVNYLDYIKSFGCKCTGVDLARRDQYKFINLYHMYILKQDLQIMKYKGNNNWQIIDKNKNMITVIDEIIDDFILMFNNASKFVEAVNQHDSSRHFEPKIRFTINAFAKTAAYRPGKDNTVSKIIEKHEEDSIEREIFKQYKPKVNERISFVVIKNNSNKMSEKCELVPILLDEIEKEVRTQIVKNIIKFGTETGDENSLYNDDRDTEDLYQSTIYVQNDIEYDEFYNAYMINKLDKNYYVEKLISAIMLYIIGDLYPKEVKDVDENEDLTEAERNNIINNLKTEATKEYMIKRKLKVPSKQYIKTRTAKAFINDQDTLEFVKQTYEFVKAKQPTEQQFIKFFNEEFCTYKFIKELDNKEREMSENIEELKDKIIRTTNIYQICLKSYNENTEPKIDRKYNKLCEQYINNYINKTGQKISKISDENFIKYLDNEIKNINKSVELSSKYINTCHNILTILRSDKFKDYLI